MDDIWLVDVEVDPDKVEVGAVEILKAVKPDWPLDQIKFKVCNTLHSTVPHSTDYHYRLHHAPCVTLHYSTIYTTTCTVY